jgi:hypothetical protein
MVARHSDVDRCVASRHQAHAAETDQPWTHYYAYASADTVAVHAHNLTKAKIEKD